MSSIQTRSHRSSARIARCIAGGLLALSAGSVASAFMDYDSFLDFKKHIRRKSNIAIAGGADREEIRRQEDSQVWLLWEDYLRKSGALASVGGMSINGITAATINNVDENGAMAVLGFNWINPVTRQPMPGGYIAAVRYLVNRDPDNDDWEELGVSSDRDNNFALNIITGGFEPDFQAIPLDAGGNPWFLPNASGFNMAFGTMTIMPFNAPSPGACSVLALAALPLLTRRRR